MTSLDAKQHRWIDEFLRPPIGQVLSHPSSILWRSDPVEENDLLTKSRKIEEAREWDEK